MAGLIDMVGKRFGRLTVLAMAGRRGKDKSAYYVCRCECGTVKEIRGNHLRRGSIVSCGCFHIERSTSLFKRISRKTHGLSSTSTYDAWKRIHQCCYNDNNQYYHYYGGRGIRVCSRWHNTFENFLADMGPRPSGHMLSRIDKDKDYSPENCKWIPIHKKAGTTQRRWYLEYGGKVKPMADWCRELGLDYRRVRGRIAVLKWPIWKALELPEC